jgi:CDP-paratose 2-epimerase
MKLLITGGCGFLGSNLASEAISQGIDLCVFDNLCRHGSQSNLEWLRSLGNFQFVHGDIRNASEVNRIVERFKPDAIFHLAGQVAMTTSINDPRIDFEVNVLGTINLLEAVRLIAPDAVVIYSSTNKVYGDLEQFKYREAKTRYVCVDHPEGFDEQTPLDFHSPYGCSKGSADQYLLDYNRIFGLKTIVFRHSSMFGGRQFATADQGWIGWFCQIASQTRSGRLKEPFTISGNGKQVRDVLHADDIVSLYFSALKLSDAAAGHAFNIGGGISNSLSLLELFTFLEDQIGQSLRFMQVSPRASDQRVFVADITKVTGKLNWVPKVTAEAGLRRMLKWVDSVTLFGNSSVGADGTNSNG